MVLPVPHVTHSLQETRQTRGGIQCYVVDILTERPFLFSKYKITF